MPPSLSLYSPRDRARELTTRNADGRFRGEFRRDFARLIHCPSFRRLQGKTQLFPSTESEYFRNRLTHSLEVAQIAKGIAQRINATSSSFGRTQTTAIDTDLVETAGLAHDLGHAPFGHIGEAALDELMRDDGGFEGNAQTLRILARLEKKTPWRDAFKSAGRDGRAGLNLTYRTLAAVLKYDQEIPLSHKQRSKSDRIEKGYYGSEADLVEKIKQHVCRQPSRVKKFKSVECQIMDLADDIAYSTYDLEDALKAGFVTPIEILAAATDVPLLEAIAKKVCDNIDAPFAKADVVRVLLKLFVPRGAFDTQLVEAARKSKRWSRGRAIGTTALIAIKTFDASAKVATDGYLRTRLTSSLVDEFIHGVKFRWNPREPALSKVWFDDSVLEKVEVLKHYTFQKLIMSPRLKLVEFRGREIVRSIFFRLESRKRKGYQLLPDDFQHWYESAIDSATRKRVVCDFVAGMTDRYALEFYGRLISSNPQTFFKPH